jgi:hypothetical protein
MLHYMINLKNGTLLEIDLNELPPTPYNDCVTLISANVKGKIYIINWTEISFISTSEIK